MSDALTEGSERLADWHERPLTDPHEGVSWCVSQTRKADPRTIELSLEARDRHETDRYLWLTQADLEAMLEAVQPANAAESSGSASPVDPDAAAKEHSGEAGSRGVVSPASTAESSGSASPVSHQELCEQARLGEDEHDNTAYHDDSDAKETAHDKVEADHQNEEFRRSRGK